VTGSLLVGRAYSLYENLLQLSQRFCFSINGGRKSGFLAEWPLKWHMYV